MSNLFDGTFDYMKVKTRGSSEMRGKTRVYFTCHPDDFERYFEEISDTILKFQDCAIFYTADMTTAIPDTYRDTDLGSMNLFVIPVTLRLLTEDNRAMRDDYAFAEKAHIPVLPLMMESGIDEFYSQKFGKRQYLSPYSRDMTEISYEEKLKKFLSSVILDDETIARIQAAFDAYIFLSYRKKDRHHANELMHLIHDNPKYRDIAIWYDEYLVPGENFDDIIRKALEKSELFTLLVTPNLINEENYVKQEEYPAAISSGKQIIPAEMVPTDRDMLETGFEGLPPCVDAHNDNELDDSLMEKIKCLAISQNDGDPEHNYLIGLAYLEGIDVEMNVERGLELITSAAEAGFIEAMKKLCFLYSEGLKTSVDYSKANRWALELYEICVRELGEKNRSTLLCLLNLSTSYNDLGDYSNGLRCGEKVYQLFCEVQGEKHPDTLKALNGLAVTYGLSGDQNKALELKEKAYIIEKELYGENHPDTIMSLHNLAASYGNLGNHEKALELKEKVYSIRCELLGEKHPDTIMSLNNLATTYSNLGNQEKALELIQKAYLISCEVLGEKHPDTLLSLHNLATVYGYLENYEKEMELIEKVCDIRRELLGEKHPDTILSLNNLAMTYRDQGKYEKATELAEKVYELSCEVLGEKHPHTIVYLDNLLDCSRDLGDYEMQLELEKKIYELRCELLGEKHPNTLTVLGRLAIIYGKLDKYEVELELEKRVYELRCEVLGEKHPKTLISLNNMAVTYGDLGDLKKCLELHEKVYALRLEILGEEHASTQRSKNKIAEVLKKINEE